MDLSNGGRMSGIRTRDEADTFTLRLLSMSDDAVIRAFKDSSDIPDERASSLCLEEMARRNLTCEYTLDARELRAAAKLARKRSVRQPDGKSGSAPASISALERLAAYLDKAASRMERETVLAGRSGAELVSRTRHVTKTSN